jgi:hypothetical protein
MTPNNQKREKAVSQMDISPEGTVIPFQTFENPLVARPLLSGDAPVSEGNHKKRLT